MDHIEGLHILKHPDFNKTEAEDRYDNKKNHIILFNQNFYFVEL